MSGGIWASHWIDWKELRGAFPLHRREVDKLLETHPALLYYGDSWFSTPLYPNLARQSMAAINGIAMIYGRPGATSKDLLGRTRAVNNLVARIEHDAFDVMLISLGGNDALDRLRTIFHAWAGGNRAPIDAPAALDRVMTSGVFGHIFDRYRRLLDRLAASNRLRPRFRVIGHGYAPPVRMGAAAKLTVGNAGLIAVPISEVGPWVFGPMKAVFGDDEHEARRFSKLLLEDGFRDWVLKPLATRFSGLFTFVEFGKIDALGDDSAWFDEIHPTVEGFAAMVPTLNAAIRAALPPGKRGTVALSS